MRQRLCKSGRFEIGSVENRKTLLEAVDSLENMIKNGKLSGITIPEEADHAKEIFLTGTSINLKSVVKCVRMPELINDNSFE